MRKRIFIATVMAAAMALSMPARANVYTFQPDKSVEMYDLPHAYYFTWGITPFIPTDEVITGATLTYYNIYDWRTERGDHLYTNLLDNPQKGVRSYLDFQGGGNNFAGQGTLVGDWTDPAGGHSTGFNLVYDFSPGLLDVLKLYASTAPGSRQDTFGFGIDPDCHYFNSGISFTITTSPAVPVPGAILLGGFGVALIGLMRRRQII